MSISLGLCCKNIELSSIKRKNNRIFCARACSRNGFFKKGLDQIKELALENIRDIIPMMIWNEFNCIRVLRLSSELLPHFNDPETISYSMGFAKNDLAKVGILARALGHRITFHPGQFNVIGTEDKVKLDKTINDLKMHAELLDLIDAGSDSVMVIHGGGLYKQKNQTLEEAKAIVIDRWCCNFEKMPENVKKRLVLENCEKSFTVEDCLKISKRVNIPVVVDTHHYECYNKLHPDCNQEPLVNLLEEVLNTWKEKNIKPKFHISEQGAGKCGNHSDYIENIPEFFFTIKEKFDTDIDIIIEAKCKEKAIKKLYEKYPELIENYKCKLIKEKVCTLTDKLKEDII